MGLLLLEVMADAGKPLHLLVDDLLAAYGPAEYARVDMALTRPVAKDEMVRLLLAKEPAAISGVAVEDIQTTDGVKYYLADGSWLLIRPSGTEPVLRVYAEAPDRGRVEALLAFGEEIAKSA
jgi:phosphomannomutase